MEKRTIFIFVIFIVLLVIAGGIGLTCNHYVVASDCINDPDMKTAQSISLWFPVIMLGLVGALIGILLGANIEGLQKL